MPGHGEERRRMRSATQPHRRRRNRHTRVASFLLGAVLAVAALVTASNAASLKPVDRATLENVVDVTARKLLVPGAMVFLRTPQGDVAISYGTTQLGATNAPDADTYFRIASNTKTMTAAIILQLAQEGKLGLDDPVSKYVPGVPNGDHIKITELLNMRSGLYNYTDAPEMSESVDHNPAKAWTPEALLALAFAHPPNFAPDAGYEYCNTNYALLGVIVEKVGGQPLAEAMHDRLFAPLGLKHTSLPPPA
jgi:D-alanyl-D-alanine carboxypeptidase